MSTAIWGAAIYLVAVFAVGLYHSRFTKTAVFWLVPGCLAGYVFNWLLVAPRLNRLAHERDVITVAAALAPPTGGSLLRIVLAIITMACLSIYIGAQFLAAGKILHSLLGVATVYGVVIAAIAIALYTVLGGMRASLATNVMKAGLVGFALIVMPLIAWASLPPLPSPPAGLPEDFFSLTRGAAGFGALGVAIGWAGIGLAYPGQPHVLQKFMVMSDRTEVMRGRWLAFIWSTLIFSGAILSGVIGRFIVAPTDSELVLVALALQLTPPFVGGMVIAAILAAAGSTIDSQLVTVSSHVKNDLGFLAGGRIDPRIATIVVAAISGGLAALNNATVFSFVLYAWEFLGVTIGMAVLGRLLFNVGAAPILVSMVIAATILMVWRSNDVLSNHLYALAPAFVIGVVILVVGRWLERTQARPSAQ